MHNKLEKVSLPMQTLNVYIVLSEHFKSLLLWMTIGLFEVASYKSFVDLIIGQLKKNWQRVYF